MITRDEVLLKIKDMETNVTLYEERNKKFQLVSKQGITKFHVSEDGRLLYLGKDLNRAIAQFNVSGDESMLFYRLMHIDRKGTPGMTEVFSDGYALNGAYVRFKGFNPIGLTVYRVIFSNGDSFDLTRRGNGVDTEYDFRSPGLKGFGKITPKQALDRFEHCAKTAPTDEEEESYRLDSAIQEYEDGIDQ